MTGSRETLSQPSPVTKAKPPSHSHLGAARIAAARCRAMSDRLVRCRQTRRHRLRHPAHASDRSSDQRHWARRNRTLKGGDGERACAGLARAGLVVMVNPALALAEPVQSACGAAIETSHPGRFPIGQSAASAPLIIWGVAGCPRRRGSRKQAMPIPASGEGIPHMRDRRSASKRSFDVDYQFVCQKGQQD